MADNNDVKTPQVKPEKDSKKSKVEPVNGSVQIKGVKTAVA